MQYEAAITAEQLNSVVKPEKDFTFEEKKVLGVEFDFAQNNTTILVGFKKDDTWLVKQELNINSINPITQIEKMKQYVSKNNIDHINTSWASGYVMAREIESKIAIKANRLMFCSGKPNEIGDGFYKIDLQKKIDKIIDQIKKNKIHFYTDTSSRGIYNALLSIQKITTEGLPPMYDWPEKYIECGIGSNIIALVNLLSDDEIEQLDARNTDMEVVFYGI